MKINNYRRPKAVCVVCECVCVRVTSSLSGNRKLARTKSEITNSRNLRPDLLHLTPNVPPQRLWKKKRKTTRTRRRSSTSSSSGNAFELKIFFFSVCHILNSEFYFDCFFGLSFCFHLSYQRTQYLTAPCCCWQPFIVVLLFGAGVTKTLGRPISLITFSPLYNKKTYINKKNFSLLLLFLAKNVQLQQKVSSTGIETMDGNAALKVRIWQP